MGVSRNDFEKMRLSCITGAGVATKITVAGMTVQDSVLGIVDLTSNIEVALTGLVMVAGGFKVTADTTGIPLLVLWFDRDAG
jgi:hypothetical protein